MINSDLRGLHFGKYNDLDPAMGTPDGIKNTPQNVEYLKLYLKNIDQDGNMYAQRVEFPTS